MKTLAKKLALVLSLMCIIGFASPVSVFATNLDNVGNSNNSSNNSGSNNSAISDYLDSYTPVTKDNMASASTYASPIVNLLGTASGFLIMVVSAGIFLVTAIDLLYIGFPALRPTLSGGAGAQGGSPMGGGMGMGMRGGMMGGGMMGGGMQGGAQSGRRCWVSDEALQCVQMAQSAQGGSPMGGGMGMGMGMGGMGGGMMGGQQAQKPATKPIIYEYLKKRLLFIIIFALASVLLMSSALTHCGINLAELGIKIFDKLNGNIANINV